MKSTQRQGLVIAGHGRHVWVETPEGERVICHPRGKKSHVVVGDRVWWLPSQDEGTIEKIETRRNLLYRQDEIRTKSFAANLDQVLIWIAAEPEFSEHQIARALIAAEAAHIPALIALNKNDLAELHGKAWQRLEPYRAMGTTVLSVSLESGAGLEAVTALLHGKTTLVLGPSGSGKSTLINQLVPQAKVWTQEISTALNSGKHTTTSTTLYWMDAERTTALIDSPGFQEFGLHHIAPTQLASLMPDIRTYSERGECKFYNCSHLHEPGCKVLQNLSNESTDNAANTDRISTTRYKIYSELHAELSSAEKRY